MKRLIHRFDNYQTRQVGGGVTGGESEDELATHIVLPPTLTIELPPLLNCLCVCHII